MAKITLYHDQSAAATCVPNIFIDQYMTRANGEYVKIYLYLLRCFAQPSADFSLSGLADHFDCTERDILRALKYWEKLRLFHLEYDANDNLSGIRMLNSAYSAAQVERHGRPCSAGEKNISFPCRIQPAEYLQHLIRKKIPLRSRVLPLKTSRIILFRQQPANAQLTRWMTPVRSVKNPMSGN